MKAYPRDDPVSQKVKLSEKRWRELTEVELAGRIKFFQRNSLRGERRNDEEHREFSKEDISPGWSLFKEKSCVFPSEEEPTIKLGAFSSRFLVAIQTSAARGVFRKDLPQRRAGKSGQCSSRALSPPV